MKRCVKYINVEIDKLTDSIENAVTGDRLQTEIAILSREDISNISKKWVFDWKYEFMQPDRDVYKLTIINNPLIVQGLISLTVREGDVYVHLIESAPFNKGENKIYVGIPGNLFAFACKLSFQRGNEGYVSFISKTKLIEHYIQVLNAEHIRNGLMIINTVSALKLINKYFKDI